MNKRKPSTIVLVTKHLHLSNGGFGGGHATNMEDIFSQFGDVFGDDMFGSFFGGGRRSNGGGTRARGQRGSNLRIKLKLNFAEIANGVNKQVKVKKHVVCTTCDGSGAKIKAAFKHVIVAMEVVK
jgi:molecular chaperone DnaJ